MSCKHSSRAFDAAGGWQCLECGVYCQPEARLEGGGSVRVMGSSPGALTRGGALYQCRECRTLWLAESGDQCPQCHELEIDSAPEPRPIVSDDGSPSPDPLES